jgi:hypothetical protein
VSAHYKCDRCPEPGVNEINGERLCDSCYDSDASCHTADTDLDNLCGHAALISAYRQVVPVYFTEVNAELGLFLTIEEQGRDLKDTLCTYGTGNLEESEKADLFEVPDAEVSNWLDENDIRPHNVSWGESALRLPKGCKLIRGDLW